MQNEGGKSCIVNSLKGVFFLLFFFQMLVDDGGLELH